MQQQQQHCLHGAITRAPIYYHFADVNVSSENATAHAMRDKILAVWCVEVPTTHAWQLVNAAFAPKIWSYQSFDPKLHYKRTKNYHFIITIRMMAQSLTESE